MDWTNLLAWLNRGPRRSEEQVVELLGVVVAHSAPLELWPVPPAADDWDLLVRLFWEEPTTDAEESKAARTFLGALLQLDPVGPATQDHYQRLLAALLVQVAPAGVCRGWRAAFSCLDPGVVGGRCSAPCRPTRGRAPSCIGNRNAAITARSFKWNA